MFPPMQQPEVSMKKLSLKNRFLLPVLALVFLGMGGISAVSYFKAKNALETEAKNQIGQMTEFTLRLVDGWLNERTMDIIGLAEQRDVRALLADAGQSEDVRKEQLIPMDEDSFREF